MSCYLSSICRNAIRGVKSKVLDTTGIGDLAGVEAVPRLQQYLYTTGSSDKTGKTTDQTKTAQIKQRSPAPPASQKQETSDGSKYGCNTYYEHKEWTFYDIESEMAKKRVGQPSPYKKTSH